MSIKKINNRIIITSRESRGYSQEEMADLLRITQGYLSKIENGFIDPDNSMISKIAQILNYNKSLFYSKYSVYSLGLNFYRKNKTLQNKYLKKLESLINIKKLSIQHLLETMEIVTNFQKINFNENLNPIEAAIACRQYWKVPKGAVSNLFEVVESAGIIICFIDNLNFEGFSGVSTILENNNNYVIFLNKQIPADRMRFTIAHELAHIILHDVPTPDSEREANLFASEFLMPEVEIFENLKNLSMLNLPLLKKNWQASMTSIIVRAHELNTISSYKYKNLLTQMAKYGYKKSEPYPELIKKENPRLMSQVIEYYRNELDYSEEEISKLSGLNIPELISEFGMQESKHKLELVKL